MYHFITGLPRAGTTLLSTVLNQNPRFQASISGPLARFVRAVVEESSAQGGYRLQCPEEKREKIIKGIFQNYYDDTEKEVFFDTNRGWSYLSPTLKQLYPSSKIIVCVRSIPWILDSFERLFRQNPLSVTNMFSREEGVSVYSRCMTLLRPDRTLGFALDGVKQLLASEEMSNSFVLEYDVFAKNPARTLRALYSFLGEEWYNHDFNNVAVSYDEFDADMNLKGLHTTRAKIEYKERKTILPPDIVQRFQQSEFWRMG